MKAIVLVNGAPASGKSTVVASLVRHLPQANVYEMDAVKEAFMDAFGAFAGGDSLRLSRAASAAIWKLIGSSAENSLSIVDCWVQESEREALITALQDSGIQRIVEVWCEAPVEVIVNRYVERVPLRHPGHLGVEFATQLREIVANAAPLGVGEVVRVQTERDDFDAVARHVEQMLRAA